MNSAIYNPPSIHAHSLLIHSAKASNQLRNPNRKCVEGKPKIAPYNDRKTRGKNSHHQYNLNLITANSNALQSSDERVCSQCRISPFRSGINKNKLQFFSRYTELCTTTITMNAKRDTCDFMCRAHMRSVRVHSLDPFSLAPTAQNHDNK